MSAALYPERDSQKTKVYLSEDTILGDRARREEALTVAESQAYIDSVTSQRWFQSRWGTRKITVVPKHHGSATGGGSKVRVPTWARHKRILLHELAHCLAGVEARHGPIFTATFLVLVEHEYGAETARALRAEWAKRKVKYRPGVSKVPKPGYRAVVTKTAVRQREAAQVERQYGSRSARSTAAATIRYQIKAGSFGPSGSAARRSALATARALEAS